MKLFVDDIRACPEGWVLARTVTESIRILATQSVEEVSLDHDIRCHHDFMAPGLAHEVYELTSPETFETVARFLHAQQPNVNSAGEICWQESLYDDDGIQSEKMQFGGGTKIRIHTSNIEKGKDMAKILGIPYVCTHYPYDFRKDREIKESWEI